MKTRSLLESFRCAAEGVSFVLRTERNMRIHFIAAAAVLVVAALLGVDSVGLSCLVMAISLVLISELANTALELVCDMISTTREPRIKTVKDIAAGAVLVSAAAAFAVGVAVLGPRLATVSLSLAGLM